MPYVPIAIVALAVLAVVFLVLYVRETDRSRRARERLTDKMREAHTVVSSLMTFLGFRELARAYENAINAVLDAEVLTDRERAALVSAEEALIAHFHSFGFSMFIRNPVERIELRKAVNNAIGFKCRNGTGYKDVTLSDEPHRLLHASWTRVLKGI